MTLLEMPGNRGQIFAIDPYRVTAVQPYRATLPGRGAQVYDMTTVWLDDRTIFVCCWKVRDTLARINEARAAGFGMWAAGYRAAAQIPWEEPGIPALDDVMADFGEWLTVMDMPVEESDIESDPEPDLATQEKAS